MRAVRPHPKPGDPCGGDGRRLVAHGLVVEQRQRVDLGLLVDEEVDALAGDDVAADAERIDAERPVERERGGAVRVVDPGDDLPEQRRRVGVEELDRAPAMVDQRVEVLRPHGHLEGRRRAGDDLALGGALVGLVRRHAVGGQQHDRRQLQRAAAAGAVDEQRAADAVDGVEAGGEDLRVAAVHHVVVDATHRDGLRHPPVGGVEDDRPAVEDELDEERHQLTPAGAGAHGHAIDGHRRVGSRRPREDELVRRPTSSPEPARAARRPTR